MQKKNNPFMLIWRVIYPLLMLLAAEFILEFVIMFGYMFYLMGNGYSVSATDTAELENLLTNFIYQYNLYILIARGIILIPLYCILMRSDVKKAPVRVQYGPYNRMWLIVVPIVGCAAAMGFNHFVPVFIEVLQSIFKTVAEFMLNKEVAVDLFKTYNEVSERIYSGGIFIQILSTVIIAPVVEELLFRGLIYKRLRANLKTVPAMLLSAFIFGLVHANIVQFVYAFLIGIIVAFVYERFRTIVAPVLFHLGANLLSVLITNFAPEAGIGLDIGTYMLITVVELAVTFILLKLIDMKVKREACPVVNSEETHDGRQ